MEIYKNNLLSPDHLYPLIGRNIKRLRRQQNMTQEMLAELIDGDQKHISKIESGKARPGLSTYLRIANVFCVSVDYFLKDTIEMTEQLLPKEKSPFGPDEETLTQDVLAAVLKYLYTKES